MNPHNAPRAIVWELSSRCNLACPGCPCATGGRKTELERREAGDVVDALARWVRSTDGDALPDATGHPGCEWNAGTLVLSGGEPLVRDDTLDLARRAIAAGIRVAMTSNGSLITSGMATSIAAAGVSAVGIPLDGCNADMHDGLRRRSGAFKGALGGVRCLADKGVPVWVMTRVLARNHGDIGAITQLARDAGAKAHFVFPVGSSPCRFPVGEADELTEGQLDALGRELAAKHGDGDATLVCSPKHTGMATAVCGTLDLSWPAPGCGAAKRVAAISADGDLYPCPGLRIPVGNVRETPIDRLWAEAEKIHEPREHAGGCRTRCKVCATWSTSAAPEHHRQTPCAC